jgi:arylsulfatase A-like enzyme
MLSHYDQAAKAARTSSKKIMQQNGQSGFRSILLMTLLALIGLPSLLVASDSPNIALIIGDDISYRDYGFMGARHVDTPNLDQLAREGMTYTRGYVPTSLCRASLMSIITGLYAHQHGIVGNDPPEGEDRAKMLWAIRKHETIPKLLSKQGYYSYQTGKWWEGAATEGGFTAGMTHGDPSKGGRHGDEGLKIGRDSLAPIEEAIASAKSNQKPFFVWYAPMLPHTPHDPPADLLEKYKPKSNSIHIAKYWANIERFDRTVGELRKILAKQEVEKNTFIIYLHDNGWIQDPAAGRFMLRSKRSPYEEGIRTPLILHWPGKIASGRDERAIVSSIDVAPTVLNACGAPAAPSMPGLNLLAPPVKRQLLTRVVYGESFAHDVASLARPDQGLEHRWLATNRWKLIFDQKSGQQELFDLTSDSGEQKNVVKEHSEVASEFVEHLNSWWNGKLVATEAINDAGKKATKP